MIGSLILLGLGIAALVAWYVWGGIASGGFKRGKDESADRKRLFVGLGFLAIPCVLTIVAMLFGVSLNGWWWWLGFALTLGFTACVVLCVIQLPNQLESVQKWLVSPVGKSGKIRPRVKLWRLRFLTPLVGFLIVYSLIFYFLHNQQEGGSRVAEEPPPSATVPAPNCVAPAPQSTTPKKASVHLDKVERCNGSEWKKGQGVLVVTITKSAEDASFTYFWSEDGLFLVRVPRAPN